MKASPMSMVGFPLLLIPLAIYNIIVLLMPGVSLAEPLIKLMLMSGAEWPVTLSDILLALAIVLLLLEVIKGAQPGAKYFTDHLLSFIVSGGAIAEFVLWPHFGTSTYFLLTMLALVDFFSSIALRARRGTRAASAVAVSGRGAGALRSAAEPQFEPAPSMPPAASVAESVLLDHAPPKIANADAASGGPSQQVPSPRLQPGNGSPSSPDTLPR
jgi:hypothetical protein